MVYSAAMLGAIYGLTGQEMNLYLEKEGFLEGTPGSYRPTEKGKKYIFEGAEDEEKEGEEEGDTYTFHEADWIAWKPEILDVIDLPKDEKEQIRQRALGLRRLKRDREKFHQGRHLGSGDVFHHPVELPTLRGMDGKAPVGKILLGGGAIAAGIGGLIGVIRHFSNRSGEK